MELGLYIHWPFCIKKCPYCDFNSYAFEYSSNTWVDALISEIEQQGKNFPEYKIKTIFFGGGTPSLIPPKQLKTILDAVYNTWEVNQNIEITLEVNPSSLETHDLEEFLKSGINRFSIGVQSLKDDNLKFLGRLHNANEAIKILTHASKICNNVSADFIYALPFESLASWKKDLSQIIELIFKLNLKHCSLYQLVIEPNTGFEQAVKSKKWVPMNDDLQSILYRHTNKILHQIHWDSYEISNASCNIDFRSQHNLIYWNYQEYLGIGAGAHSRMKINGVKHKFNNTKLPQNWLAKVKNNANNYLENVENLEKLDEKNQFTEKILMGMRLKDGIIIEENEMQYIEENNLNLLMKKKFIKLTDGRYNFSLNGRLKLNSILNMILK